MADNMNGSIMEEDNSFGGRVKKAAKRVDDFWRGVTDFINPNVAREGFTPSNIARDVNMWIEPVSQMALDEAQGRAEYPAWAFGLGAVPVLGKGAPYIAKVAGKATELTKPLMTALEKLGKGEGKIGGRNAEQVVKEYNANDRVYWELVNKRNELQNKVNAGNATEAEKKALADLEKQTDAALYQLNESAKTFSDDEWLRNFDKEHVRGEDLVENARMADNIRMADASYGNKLYYMTNNELQKEYEKAVKNGASEDIIDKIVREADSRGVKGTGSVFKVTGNGKYTFLDDRPNAGLIADTPAGSYNAEFVPGEGSIMDDVKPKKYVMHYPDGGELEFESMEKLKEYADLLRKNVGVGGGFKIIER